MNPLSDPHAFHPQRFIWPGKMEKEVVGANPKHDPSQPNTKQ
jgi:hypothetical protein